MFFALWTSKVTIIVVKLYYKEDLNPKMRLATKIQSLMQKAMEQVCKGHYKTF
jgi:hypothetical protein